MCLFALSLCYFFLCLFMSVVLAFFRFFMVFLYVLLAWPLFLSCFRYLLMSFCLSLSMSFCRSLFLGDLFLLVFSPSCSCVCSISKYVLISFLFLSSYSDPKQRTRNVRVGKKRKGRETQEGSPTLNGETQLSSVPVLP